MSAGKTDRRFSMLDAGDRAMSKEFCRRKEWAKLFSGSTPGSHGPQHPAGGAAA